jgi:hypothetical protein
MCITISDEIANKIHANKKRTDAIYEMKNIEYIYHSLYFLEAAVSPVHRKLLVAHRHEQQSFLVAEDVDGVLSTLADAVLLRLLDGVGVSVGVLLPEQHRLESIPVHHGGGGDVVDQRDRAGLEVTSRNSCIRQKHTTCTQKHTHTTSRRVVGG